MPWVFTPDAQGSFPAEMDAVSRQRGFLSYPVDRLEDVLAEVAAGHPVLVLQNLATDWYPRWHFAVVVGYDLERQELVLRSGELKRRITEFELFDTTWARGKRWARVILPPAELPATARPERWVQAAADLEQTGPAGAALPAFRSALLRWPKLPPARFGLATGLLNQGDAAAARIEFETLLRQHPTLAAGWNNYGYALKALNCPASARTVVACALKLEPDNADFADTARVLETSSPDAPRCGTPLVCPVPNPP
jgi:tetratricopeptide (TPR) repeat protein